MRGRRVRPRINVSALTLLKGSWYAAEQCGYLLQQAVVLLRSQVYSTAAAVALIGREQLGAHRILRDEWKKAIGTRVEPDADDLRTALQDHLLKQQRSMLVLTYMDQGGGALDKLTRKMFDNPPPSEEYEKARVELDEALSRMAKRAPDQRHSTRMRSLYVDLNESGTDWNRPAEFSPLEATRCVLDSVNDYARVYDGLRPVLIDSNDPQFAVALAAWTEKPPLPAPDFNFKIFPWNASEQSRRRSPG